MSGCLRDYRTICRETQKGRSPEATTTNWGWYIHLSMCVYIKSRECSFYPRLKLSSVCSCSCSRRQRSTTTTAAAASFLYGTVTCLGQTEISVLSLSFRQFYIFVCSKIVAPVTHSLRWRQHNMFTAWSEINTPYYKSWTLFILKTLIYYSCSLHFICND